MEIEDIINEWSYRLPKGYPTMKDGKFTDPSELKVLHEILRENGINEMPSFVKSKTSVSDVIREEEGDVTSVPERVSKEMLYKALEKLNPDELSDKSIRVLYGKIQSFLAFKPIRQALKNKNFVIAPPTYNKKTGDLKKTGFDMPKKIASELQQMLIGFNEKDYDQFVKYISGIGADGGYDSEKTGMDPLKFEDAIGYGNLEDLMPSYLSKEVARAFASYTGQDEKKRGVGMAEILMALVFVNIKNPAGAGDLQINDRLLEVKGAPAVLGSLNEFKNYKQIFIDNGKDWMNLKGRQSTSGPAQEKLAKGIATHNKILLSDLSYGLSQIAQEEPEIAKSIATDLLNTTVGGGKKPLTKDDVSAGVGLIKWKNATEGDINRVFGLTNFLRYAREEEFTAFIAFDYGTSGAKKGDYVYVQGEPLEMAKDLMKLRVPFEPSSVGTDAAWPRINVRGRQGTDGVMKESEEELEY